MVMSEALEQIPASGRAQEIPYGYPSMGLGHCITPDVPAIPTGCSLRTYDVNLDSVGQAAQRGGVQYIVENGACGVLITTCEEAGWTGGAADSSTDVDGVDRWRHWGYGGAGSASRKITAATGLSTSAFYTIPGPINLGQATDEYICYWAYVYDITRVSAISLRVGTDSSNYYRFNPATSSLKNGWNFLSQKKSDATAINPGGTLSWLNISHVSFFVSCVATVGADAEVSFDNVWLGPAHLYGLFNYRRSIAKGGGNWIVAAGRDSLCILIPEERRWKFLRGERGIAQAGGASTVTLSVLASATDDYYKGQLITIEGGAGVGQTQRIISYNGTTKIAVIDAPWGVAVGPTSSYVVGALAQRVPVNFVAINDWLYVMNGVDRMLLLTDNMRAYDAGIDAPTTIPAVAVGAVGGSVVSGTHFLAVRFYSSLTGRESDPVFSATISVGQNNSTLSYTNLPVSLDPKVDYLRIYRLAPGQPGYKRASGSLFGEVANGVTVFTDTLTSTSLGDIMDRSPAGGDDLNGVPPRARVGTVLGNFFIVDNADQPGRLHVARVGAGEQWPLDASIAIDEGDNDDITALVSNWGLVVAFKSGSLYPLRLAGGGLQPFVVQDKRAGFGAVSQGAVQASADVIRFRNFAGYFQFGPDMRPYSSTNGWRFPARLPMAKPSIADFDSGRSKLMTSAYLSRRRQVYFTEVVQGGIYPSVQSVLHEDLDVEVAPKIRGGWAFHRAPVSILANAQVSGTAEDYIIAGGSAGIVYRLDIDYPNDMLVSGDAAIDMHYVTPPLDQRERAYGLGPSILKHYRWLDMILRPGDRWMLDVEGYFDWRQSEPNALYTDALVSATATTATLGAGASTRDNEYAGKWLYVLDGAGIDQVRQIVRYAGATKICTLDTAWTITPAAPNRIAVRTRLQAVGTLSTTVQSGEGIGLGFTIGVSAIAPSGGEFQRMRLPRGRHRSITLGFRNNRLNEAPGVTQFSLWVIAMRASGRIA